MIPRLAHNGGDARALGVEVASCGNRQIVYLFAGSRQTVLGLTKVDAIRVRYLHAELRCKHEP